MHNAHRMTTMAKPSVVTAEYLAKEYETYKAKLPELARHEGKFVLIHGADVVGLFDSYEEALAAGYQKIGLDKPFFVRKISPVEIPIYIRI
jgi:hypothetical protein